MKIQDTILICPPVISQYAALGALQVGANYCKEKIGAIASVRQLALESLKRLEGLCTIAPADGAFYFFLKVHTKLGAFELAERLIREHRVAVMPGTTFGMDDGCYLRVAYGALQKETVAEGIERLVRGLQTILGSENS
jgi:aspartate/methionine/tyrosine aminotransferase